MQCIPAKASNGQTLVLYIPEKFKLKFCSRRVNQFPTCTFHTFLSSLSADSRHTSLTCAILCTDHIPHVLC